MQGVMLAGDGSKMVYYTQDNCASGRSHFGLSKYYGFAVGDMVYSGRRLPRFQIALSASGMAAAFLEVFCGFLPAGVGGDAAVRVCDPDMLQPRAEAGDR